MQEINFGCKHNTHRIINSLLLMNIVKASKELIIKLNIRTKCIVKNKCHKRTQCSYNFRDYRRNLYFILNYRNDDVTSYYLIDKMLYGEAFGYFQIYPKKDGYIIHSYNENGQIDLEKFSEKCNEEAILYLNLKYRFAQMVVDVLTTKSLYLEKLNQDEREAKYFFVKRRVMTKHAIK